MKQLTDVELICDCCGRSLRYDGVHYLHGRVHTLRFCGHSCLNEAKRILEDHPDCLDHVTLLDDDC